MGDNDSDDDGRYHNQNNQKSTCYDGELGELFFVLQDNDEDENGKTAVLETTRMRRTQQQRLRLASLVRAHKAQSLSLEAAVEKLAAQMVDQCAGKQDWFLLLFGLFVIFCAARASGDLVNFLRGSMSALSFQAGVN